MAFVGYDKLEELLKDGKVISPFNPKLLEGTSYQLTLGEEVFTTNAESGKKEILDKKNPLVEIKPGQFALLMTHEKVTVPTNMLAFIGVKFSIKVKGLINISGFHVDPDYTGNLIFSVYNAGARSIILEREDPCFSIWFSWIEGTKRKTDNSYSKKNKNYGLRKIPKEFISDLKGHLWNPFELTNRIKDLEGIKKNNQWLISTFIGILIVIALKIFWNWDLYKKGYKEGFDNSSKEKIEQIIYEMNIDSIISHKADSIVVNKVKGAKL
jgi:dCTP deaminase